MKPTVFNYQEYERVVEENKKLNAEVADLRIRIADGDKRDCKSCKHQKADGCSRWDCEYEPVMSDLISRQDAIDECDKQYPNIDRQDFKAVINAVPSADAVEVVRCKDCKYAHMTYGGECKYCDMWEEDGEALYLDGDFYCAYGERREP